MTVQQSMIIACAFGQQGGDLAVSGPSNDAIVQRAEEIRKRERSVGIRATLSLQWEGKASNYVDTDRLDSTITVSEFKSATHYIDTKGVLERSLAEARKRGITRIIIVAHPHHLPVINFMLKTAWKELLDGFTRDTIYDQDPSLPKIPYDHSPGNIQWWTRNPILFYTYLVKAGFTTKHGN